MTDDIVTRLRDKQTEFDNWLNDMEGKYSFGHDESIWSDAADEIDRLQAENQMLNEALASKGTKQVAKIVATTSSCDEWMLPIFAKNNRHLCDACGGEKYHHSYEWVPALMPIGGSYKPWSLEQIHKWRDDGWINNERYHFLVSVTKDFDKPRVAEDD